MQHHESKEGLSRTVNSGDTNRASSGRMVDLSNSENMQILSKGNLNFYFVSFIISIIIYF